MTRDDASAGARKGVAGHYRRGYDAYRAAVGDQARQATLRPVRSSSEYLADRMADVPVLVLACIEAAAELPAGNQAQLWGSLLPTAYYTGETFRPAAREPLDTVLHLDHW